MTQPTSSIVPISAAVLTKNRPSQLSACLRSLSWCQEVIVVDDESDGDTKVLAQSFRNVRYFHRPLDNDFAAQHNFALAQAKHDWTLFVDDDETVSTKLAQEIVARLKNREEANGYFLRRDDFFMGRSLRFGETSNVKLLRLGRTHTGKWTRKVHEVWNLPGPLANLDSSLEHHPHPTTREFVQTINSYTSIDAVELSKERKGFSLFRATVNPIAKFIQNYLVRLGFLDGMAGLVVAFMMSVHSLTVRVKQYDLSRTS